MGKLDTILGLMASEDAEGLRMRVGAPPELLLDGVATPLTMPSFDEGQLGEYLREIATDDDMRQLYTHGEVTLVYEYRGRSYYCMLATGTRGPVLEFRTVEDADLDGLSLDLDDLSDPGQGSGGGSFEEHDPASQSLEIA